MQREPKCEARASTSAVYVVRTQPNESRLSCGALKKDSFLNLRAPSASKRLLGPPRAPRSQRQLPTRERARHDTPPCPMAGGTGRHHDAEAQIAVTVVC